MTRTAICIAKTIIIGIIIIVLAFLPVNLNNGHNNGFDKVYHFAAFFCLAFTLLLVWRRGSLWILLGVIILGGLIELTQPLIGRQSELADFVANGVGSIAGVVISHKRLRWLCLARDFNN